MPKLIDKVKPSVLIALDRHIQPKYPSSHKMIIASLKDVNHYRDLTILQIQTLLTFLPEEFLPTGLTASFYYGDYILQQKYQVK